MNICLQCKRKYKDKGRGKKYCSGTCYEEHINQKSEHYVREKYLWKAYWEVKLYNFPLRKITREEYETIDYINKRQLFTNLRAQ